nr:hypothetical protein [uncultured Sphingorhabdus sp.]
MGEYRVMETRVIVAYALCAALVLVILFAVSRYLKKRREFKTRQMGRGKNIKPGFEAPK